MMIRGHYWLNNDQFARLEPLLSTDTRGKPRFDNRRVISGIIHVLKSGRRSADGPEVYGPSETLYNPIRALGGQGRVDRYLPSTGVGWRSPRS